MEDAITNPRSRIRVRTTPGEVRLEIQFVVFRHTGPFKQETYVVKRHISTTKSMRRRQYLCR